ncbi:hypothetical protein LTR36_007117 [Oleoguttula mirabilis]|uniref:Uncharacterized protein n=1 Tax=Oleoguttula mirabilis TaxID=1507867 RepID=A0AAV9JB93_9PEZI|nr:hypothetical protein LTR36_007117 [Oleoguttula mirabilis]
MKIRSSAVAAIAATGTYAQSNTTWIASTMTTASSSVSYTTVTYDDCPSQSMESMITVTNGVTVTYCPECEMQSQTSKPSGPGYTTTYTTTYLSLCPTGVVPATYTVTESCTDATPTWTPGPSHIPNGFTVTTKQCTVCDTTPTAVTITEPCGCEATEGVPASNTAVMTTPAAPGGGSGSPSGSPAAATSPAACNGEDCGGSGNQSPSGKASASVCNGADCGGSANTSPAPAAGASGSTAPPYPTASTITETCPGPQCRAAASSYPSGVSYGNTSGIEPSPGAASSLSSIGVLSSFIMAVIVAALAFML